MAVGSGKKKKQTKKTAAKTKETASSPHPKEWQEQIRELQEQRNRDYRILDKIWGIIFLAVGIFLILEQGLEGFRPTAHDFRHAHNLDFLIPFFHHCPRVHHASRQNDFDGFPVFRFFILFFSFPNEGFRQYVFLAGHIFHPLLC